MIFEDQYYPELIELREIYFRVCAKREALEEKCASVSIQRNVIVDLARAVLDAHEYDQDDDTLAALRQELWNASDTEAKIADEGYDRS